MFRFSLHHNKACVQYKEYDAPGPWRGDWLNNQPIPVFTCVTPIRWPVKVPVMQRQAVENLADIKKKVDTLDAWFTLEDDLAVIAADCTEGVHGRFNAKLLECPVWWREWIEEETDWQKSKTQQKYVEQWSFNWSSKCAALTTRGRESLSALEVAEYEVEFNDHNVDLYLFTSDNMPPKSFRFDLEEGIELGEVVMCKFATEGSTNGRGWELGQVIQTLPNREIIIAYLQPRKQSDTPYVLLGLYSGGTTGSQGVRLITTNYLDPFVPVRTRLGSG